MSNDFFESMIDERLSNGDKLSDGEAVIILDEIHRRKGEKEFLDTLNEKLPHLKERVKEGKFDVSKAKNLNQDIVRQIIAISEKEHITENTSIETNTDSIKTKRLWLSGFCIEAFFMF